MKLRNKKTNLIGEVGYLANSQGTIMVNNINDQDELYEYDSLAELNEEWEDYEEPKKHHYYIEPRGQVVELEFGDDIDELKEELSEIGNYFETEEEAEKAVEKLKAWKRLKDKGFKFKYIENNHIEFNSGYIDNADQFINDMDLIFGGEE